MYMRQMEFMPNDPWIMGNYASYALFTLGQFDEAVSYCNKALAIRDYRAARSTLAAAYLRRWYAQDRNKLPRAQKNLAKSLEINNILDTINWMKKFPGTKEVTDKAEQEIKKGNIEVKPTIKPSPPVKSGTAKG